jgi:LPXTG-motif cell wall-anchored protein
MRNSIAALIACVALFAGLPVRGDEGNQRTTLTFSQPVELPGVVLPAGKYVFKLIWGNTYRNVIQVSNAEETKVLATLLAIHDYRLKPTQDTVIRFAERPVNRPEAIRGWFYPGLEFGHEFVYAKKRATELAEATHQVVPFADVTPTEQPAELEKAPVAAMTPEKKEVQIAQAIEVSPPARTEIAQARESAPAPAPAELPKTGSPLPLIALGGILSLVIAGALKYRFKHVS